VTWLDFYLICFGVGGGFSLMALMAGTFHAPHVHLHHGGGNLGGAFNMGTISAFLLWFGAAGYVITRFESWWFIWALLSSALLGLFGASMVFWFIARVLMHNDVPLDPADYDMIGVLGRVTSTVRQGGGTGEITYSQQGRRCAAPIRSEDGRLLPKGTEVIVTRYEKGIAYVRSFDEMTRESAAS
jgi:membrane protein implicated in regulation of membrane protease activity